MIIRNMQISDYERVFQLWMSCKNMGFNNIDDSKTGIERFIKRNPNTSFIAEENDRIIAVVMAVNDGRRGYIYHMAVHEDFRRQKIASKLLEKCLKALKKENINKVALLVFNKNNQANSFWEKQGFIKRTDITYRNKELTELIRIDT